MQSVRTKMMGSIETKGSSKALFQPDQLTEAEKELLFSMGVSDPVVSGQVSPKGIINSLIGKRSTRM